MARFEPGSSVVERDRSMNCAKQTARVMVYCMSCRSLVEGD